MKKLRPRLVLALSLTFLLSTTTTALAASRSVPTAKLRAAIGAESNVIALLRNYAATSSWKVQFKSAEAAQATALAKVDASPSPASPPMPTGLLAGVRPTQRVVDYQGNVYSVTVARVWVVSAESGTRHIATKLSILDIGKTPVHDQVDNDLQLVGSNNNVYTFAPFETVSGCSDFGVLGSFDLEPRGSVTGCIVFDVPMGVSVIKVQWIPNTGNGPQVYSWAVKV